MRKKEKYNEEEISEILQIYRHKVLQIHKLLFFKEHIESYRQSFQNLYFQPNAAINNIYSSLDFSIAMLISRIFDEDERAFSVFNLIKIINKQEKDFPEIEIALSSEDIKRLNIWRGNVFAHDNFDVALSSSTYYDIYPDHLLDFVFKDLLNFLFNLLIQIEFYFNKNYKTILHADEIMKKELKHKEGLYKKDIELILKTIK